MRETSARTEQIADGGGRMYIGTGWTAASKHEAADAEEQGREHVRHPVT
jgi:hypothetical protein